jgi:hypothetical protein
VNTRCRSERSFTIRPARPARVCQRPKGARQRRPRTSSRKTVVAGTGFYCHGTLACLREQGEDEEDLAERNVSSHGALVPAVITVWRVSQSLPPSLCAH